MLSAANDSDYAEEGEDKKGGLEEAASSSSGSESVSGAENDLDENEIASQCHARLGRPLEQDFLETLEEAVLDQSFNNIMVNVEECIYSVVEFSIELYKLSPHGRRVHFIPQEFIQRLRDLYIPIGSSRYVSDKHLLIFHMKLDLYNSIVGIMNELSIFPEDIENGHSIRAVSALSRYFTTNMRDRNTVLNPLLLELFMRFPDLRTYQQRAVEFAINRRGRCVFADEGGMGKRVEAIVTGSYYKKEWPMLIICATSRILDWNLELLKQGIQKKTISLLYTIEDCEKLNSNDEDHPSIVVIGYKTLQDREATDELKTFQCKVLILDESHRIKHYRTKTTQVVRHLAKRAKRRIFLTANPAFGVPEELFHQLHVLDRVAFKHYLEFANQYCGIETDEETGKLIISKNWRRAKNLTELKHILFGTLVIRHFRPDHHVLPTIRREKVLLEFHPDQRTRRLLGAVMYQASQLQYHILNDEFSKGSHIFKWFKRSGIAKLMEICKYLDAVNYIDSKVIIYARHKKVMDGIEQLLKRKKISHVIVKGAYEIRQDASDKFNTDPKVRVALLSLDISNVCINLSSANLVIFAELFWVPDGLFRNENRSYILTSRVNASREIQVKYLIAKHEDSFGSALHIDSTLWEMLSGKMDVLRQLGFLRPQDDFTDTINEINFRGVPSDVIADVILSDMSSSEGSDSDEYQPSTVDSEEGDEDSSDSDVITSQSSTDSEADDNIKRGVEVESNTPTVDTSPLRRSDCDAINTDENSNSETRLEDDARENGSEKTPSPRRISTRSQAVKSLEQSESESEESVGDNSKLTEVCFPSRHVETHVRRFERLGSTDTDSPHENANESDNSIGSLREFLSTDSEADVEEEEDEEYKPGKRKTRSPKKRERRTSTLRNKSTSEESEDDSEEYEKDIAKTRKSFLR